MFNPNPNMWPPVTPLVQQSFGYINEMAINSVFLPSNQQNVNSFDTHLYCNQNNNFGQHFNQYNNSYDYFRPQIVRPLSANIDTYAAQPNHSFAANPSAIQSTVTANQFTDHSNEWLNQLNSTQRQVLDQLNKEQEEFELQFRNWEKDFDNWKQLNEGHPDQGAYRLYVSQWQEWRQRLVNRKNQMKELSERTLRQLYSQVKQQCIQTPPPNPSLPPLPPPQQPNPPPPPPPQPPPTEPKSETTNMSSLLSPQKILEIQRNINLNENKFNVNLEDIKSVEKNVNQLNSKSDKSVVEVIDIDCENSYDNKLSDSKIDAKPDAKVITKVAEDILFIQKQQELLKTIESLKNIKSNTNSSAHEIQVLKGPEEPKGFNMKEIVTKMKAIRPPEDPTEANKTVSQLPSLQGIVFKTPDLESHSIRQQMASNNSQSFERNLNHSHQQSFHNNPNPLSAPDYRMQGIRHNLPLDSFHNHLHRHPFPLETYNTRPPMPTHSTNIDRRVPQQKSFGDNHRTNSSSNTSGERDYYYRLNDSPSAPQTATAVRKYLAQTIDYNHRNNTTNDFDIREEVSGETNVNYMRKPKPKPKLKPNQMFDKNLNVNNFQRNAINFENENQLDSSSQKGFDSPEKTFAVTEEPIPYTNLRFFTHPKTRIIPIDALLKPPTRHYRPENIVIVLRGLPGSGKSYIAKLIKESEVMFNGSAPRILSIDDYFMTEAEKQTKDPETGKMIETKEYVYEYEPEMEFSYRESLLKTYKRTVDDRFFPFIIVDAVNEMVRNVEEFYSYAINNRFVVYVIEMHSKDPNICHKNNIHKRSFDEIHKLAKKWQKTPEFMLRLDIQSLLQNVSVKTNTKIQSKDTKSDENKRKSESVCDSPKKQLKTSSDSEDLGEDTQISLSRWERMEASEAKLDKLDSYKLKHKSQTIDEYLEVTDDYEQRGQKRVRWADIEEKKKQDRMRDRGYVVGQNWHQLMDPEHCERALTQTKYF